MEIFKVIGVGIVGAICVLFLRQAKSETAVIASLATGVVILILVLSSLSDVILAFNDIVDKSGISNNLFSGLLKIVGIGYVTEYSAGICSDLDCGSIGKKIQLSGKITIFLMAMPIVTALIKTVTELSI